MKLAAFSCLLTAFCATAFASEPTASPASTPLDVLSIPTSSPEPISDPNHLEIRQGAVVTNPAATLNPSQYPSITTNWVQTVIGSTTTYVPIVYTQTFPLIPDQLPSPGSGSIGYGTLTKQKRDLEARATGYAQSIILELPTEMVTQWIRPVTEVMILHTVTILPNLTLANATINGNGTTNGTLASNYYSRNYTLPASLTGLGTLGNTRTGSRPATRS